jgi:hypothetical protein
VTATNGERGAILAGLNPKNGNALFDKNKPEDPTKSTPFVVPNSNHFVFAKLTRAQLIEGVVLNMMVGNRFDEVGKVRVQLKGDNIEIVMNGEGKFGVIAFNQLPVTNNGNIHSQKEKDLAQLGATGGFNHALHPNNETQVKCPAEDIIYLYIHCDPIRFYNAIIAW